MAEKPYTVSGTITDSRSLQVSAGVIKFTSSSIVGSATSNDKGQYVFDLANIGYTLEDTVTYVCEDKFKNEYFSGSFVVSGENKSLNVQLSVISDKLVVAGNRDVQVSNIGGEPVSKDNPFPVEIINSSDLFDVVNNASSSWLITRSDGQPDSESIVIKGITYKRTFTYSAQGIMTARSAWAKQ